MGTCGLEFQCYMECNMPMQHRFAPEAIDRTLRDFMNQPDLPFGGITVAFGGDFQ